VGVRKVRTSGEAEFVGRETGTSRTNTVWAANPSQVSWLICFLDIHFIQRPVALTPLTREIDGPLPVSKLKTFPNSTAFRAPGPRKTPQEILAEWEERAQGQTGAGSYPPAPIKPARHVVTRTRSGRPIPPPALPISSAHTNQTTEVQVAVLIRMPIVSTVNLGRTDRSTEEEEETAVQEEWEGIEMGLCTVEVDMRSLNEREGRS
jgi:hypothetical protein